MQRQTGNLYMAVAMTLLCSASAQRPSFAGPRPTNGFNQKDKYHQTSDTGNDITNRFGEADSPVVNTLAFGAPQNPPVGYPVVSPLPALVPLEDRFGEIDTIAASHPALNPHAFGPQEFGSPAFGPQGFSPSFFGGSKGGSAQAFIPQNFGSQGGNTQGLGAQGANSQGNTQAGNSQGVNTQSVGAQNVNTQGLNPQSLGAQGTPIFSGPPTSNPQSSQSSNPQTTVQPQAGQVPSSVAATTSGGSGGNVQSQRLPFDAHGDQLLIDQLNALPVEKRPFWFLNYQAIEAQRNTTTPFVGGLSPRGSFFG